MKFYVSWIREYPIYEPAEGGYRFEVNRDNEGR